MAASDWNAVVYHRVSEPQFAWGMAVLDRLAVDGHERVLDVGCGTGRLTRELVRRVPRGIVIGADRSAAMLDEASALLTPVGVPLVRADASRLPFHQEFDVVFSTATFHWVPDHEALFASLFQALRPGGRLHAQCGGGPNLARLRANARTLTNAPSFSQYFTVWQEPWLYADSDTTAARLRAAGFEDVVTSLHPAPITFGAAEPFQVFVDHVCLRPYLDRLPPDLRTEFSDELVRRASRDTPPYTLDYWRLNMQARRGIA